jgi:hypothetical protein
MGFEASDLHCSVQLGSLFPIVTACTELVLLLRLPASLLPSPPQLV